MSNFIKVKLTLQIQSEGKKAKDKIGATKIYFSESYDGNAVSFDYMLRFKGYKGEISYILAYCEVKTLLFVRDALRNNEYYGYNDKSELVRPC
jgi:hypothetical protein